MFSLGGGFMATVSGPVSDVTTAPSGVSAARVRAPRARPDGTGLVTPEQVIIPVEGGRVSFEAAAGPAVLTLVRGVAPSESVRLLVGAGDVSLGDAVRAAQAADDLDREALDALAASAGESASVAREAAGEAKTHAGAASSAAESAGRDAKDAAVSASRAASSASGATQSAGKAAASASQAGASASDAKASATAASTSASQARASADRAGKIASSTSWSGDRLTVNGKQSPPLTGPRGPMGRVEGHTHPISEVNGLQDWLDWHKSAHDEYERTFSLMAPREDVSALRKDLVSVRAELESVRARPALWSGSGKPPASIPGARSGDWWLDVDSRDLYQITGV